MENRWNDAEAAHCAGPLELRAYSSRLLGCDPSLVLHGGGNTSVKLVEPNLFGEPEEILYVKGSGWDLESIQPAGFSPCRRAHLLRLLELPALSDVQMMRELQRSMTNPSAPAPSVESILHAILPFPFVDHTHADAVVTITNTSNGEARIREAYGDAVVVVPYVMPGFDLAKVCAELYPAQAGPNTVGVVLLKHGIFSFGETARDSYERMIELVSRAEAYLKRHDAWHISIPAAEPPRGPLREELAGLRKRLSEAAGFPVVVATHTDPPSLSFARHEDLADLAQQGPATPDHVIRTKRWPLIGRDVEAYRAGYQAYFERNAPSAAGGPLTMLDPAPRVLLDPELGMLAVGRTAKEAAIVEDIYRHTMEVILRATALERYEALPEARVFQVEYWDLEQAKLRRQGKPPPYAGEVALVTGAASGIGKACAEALLARGAAVVGLDITEGIGSLYRRPDFLGVRCDVTDETAVAEALEQAVRRFGGLDMLILNAGIFGASRRLEALGLDEWQRTMRVNLDANVALLREAYPLLACAPRGGRVVVIGSKNVPAPGPGAAAYSASKAALTQLARVAALEWGAKGIRVNVIHPNQVFDTGIWTEEVLRSRAQQYGLSVEEYRRNNVLRVEVTSRDVAELAAEMCGPLFAKTTGAQVPVDGGNERVI